MSAWYVTWAISGSFLYMIALDCSKSGIHGLSICQEIRIRYSGLLVLVSGNEDDRFQILALDLGADAIFPRTTVIPLVAANIKALLRRFAPATPPPVLTFGRLTVDVNRRDVFVAGEAV